MQMEQRENLRSKLAIILSLVAFFLPIFAFAQDLIIFRDGTERIVKIDMVSSEITSFYDSKKKDASLETEKNSNIYMIKYAKRGNMFFTEDGQRFSGEGDGKIPSSACCIYFIEGRELIAYNVSFDSGNVFYYESKKKGSQQFSIPTDIIFLIKYPDGTKDLVNDFEELKRKKAEALAEKQRLEEEARLAELRSRYPRNAVISTIKGVEINVCLLSEDDNVITYKKAKTKNSPIFSMDRSNIKEIKYNND